MKFAHIADCHLGGWREEEMKKLGVLAFDNAIEECISRNIDFILIAGDLFNTALPSIDIIKEAARILMKAKKANIPVYIIPGSHDFSPSGKTMLDVFENAELVKNVMRIEDNKLKIFTDEKTGVKLAGLYGKKGGLEKDDYDLLDFSEIEKEIGFKIFLLHTAIEEFKPIDLEQMEALSIKKLPKNFNYYASGHIHYILDEKIGSSKLVFPGALFPNNFRELEKFGNGGFYICDDNLNTEYIPITVKEVVSINIDANGKSPEEIEKEMKNKISQGKIMTFRIKGVLREGKPSNINFKDIGSEAYCVLRNTAKLSGKENLESSIEGESSEEIEENVLTSYFEKDLDFKIDKEKIALIMDLLDKEKHEDEKNADFEARIISDVIQGLDMEEVLKC